MAAVLVAHDRPTCRFAWNALLGAVRVHRAARRVEVVVARSPAEVIRAVAAALAEGRRPVVGWSFYTASAAEVAGELALVRAAHPAADVLHVAGGAHASGAPELTLRAGFDLVAVGEGEDTLPRLLGAVADGADPRLVPGLAWLEDAPLGSEGGAVRGADEITLGRGGEITLGRGGGRGGGVMRTSGRGALVDLDAFPPCVPEAGRVGPIEITRGCVWGCRFCQTPFLFKARFRHRSLASIRAAIRAQRALREVDVRFITPSALSWGSTDGGCDPAAVEELLAAAREEAGPARRGARVLFGTFPSELRPEHVTARTLGLIRRFCDNRMVIVGGQSGSDRLLAAMGRGHDSEAVRRAVAVALECGFRPSVDFVFGLPGEVEEDRAATRQLVESLARMGARVHAHAFDPLPGTPWRSEPRGRLDPATAALLSRLHSGGRAYGEWH